MPTSSVAFALRVMVRVSVHVHALNLIVSVGGVIGKTAAVASRARVEMEIGGGGRSVDCPVPML